ncbi:MAG: hypothetical protein WC516_07485 [Patescibacteria group bacterium]
MANPDFSPLPQQYPGPKKTNAVLIVVVVLVAVIVLGASAAATYFFLQTNYGPNSNAQPQEQVDANINNNINADLPPTEETTTPTSTPGITGQIQWQDPQEITSLKLFNESDKEFNREKTAKYYSVGKVLAGRYQGGEIILVSSYPEGPSFYPEYHRFIRLNDQLVLLKNNSGDLYEGNGFLENKFKIDSEYTITALNFPATLTPPNSQATLKLDAWTNSFFSLNGLKRVFDDPKLGPVYTTAGYPTEFKEINSRHGFFLKAPDGTVKVYSLTLGFVGGDNVPQVTWSDGTENSQAYDYTDRTGCGQASYASVVDEANVTASDLTLGGKTAEGGDIYIFKNTNHALLKDLYNNKYQTIDGAKKVPYATFIKDRPIFFWRDSFGRLIKFQSAKFAPLAECGKPVIYLYPKEKTIVSVKLQPQGGFSYTEPKYNNGWTVEADQQSNLKNLADGKTYPYLFWEGSGGIYRQPEKGFVIKQSEVHSFLVEKLTKLGLINKEIKDFMEFWEPRMTGSPYYFVTFLGTNMMDQLAPMQVSPQPDTVIRVLMDYSPLASPVKVEGYNITTPARNGFTVVEWGGVLR